MIERKGIGIYGLKRHQINENQAKFSLLSSGGLGNEPP